MGERARVCGVQCSLTSVSSDISNVIANVVANMVFINMFHIFFTLTAGRVPAFRKACVSCSVFSVCANP